MDELGMMLAYGITAYPALSRLLARFGPRVAIDQKDLRSLCTNPERSRSHASCDSGPDHHGIILRLHGRPSSHVSTDTGKDVALAFLNRTGLVGVRIRIARSVTAFEVKSWISTVFTFASSCISAICRQFLRPRIFANEMK